MTESLFPAAIEVVDSHTEGEPTRLVIDGWPTCEGDSMQARRDFLKTHHDHLRRAVVCEPRGHDAVVGALLTPPVQEGSLAGVIFFNNVGYLGMCGHGLIGVVQTLVYLGRLKGNEVRLDTPVGRVAAELGDDGTVTIENVPAWCRSLDVEVDVPGLGRMVGDVAWGGNWFFLTRLEGPSLELENVERLLEATSRIRRRLDELNLVGEQELIDHVELFGPPTRQDADSRNFVLCPGGEYDRSPCGTGTSAKMAVLHARGELAIGQPWRQESITGSRFVGWLAESDGELIPYIQGRAFVTARSTLLFDPDDFFRGGFSAR
jgi:4-hydroxyproline epimerase